MRRKLTPNVVPNQNFKSSKFQMKLFGFGAIFWIIIAQNTIKTLLGIKNLSEIYSQGVNKLKFNRSIVWCHGSTAAAMPTMMLDDPGSNPGVNHGCMYSRRTNVFCLVISNYVVYHQLGKNLVDVSVYLFI
jgi:hypothetical protein